MNAPVFESRPATLIDELRDGNAHREGAAMCERAAHALELARELFAVAACTREINAEGRALEAHNKVPPTQSNAITGARLTRARARHEAKRREALERFNRATGLVR
jgi:hypothetical protein